MAKFRKAKLGRKDWRGKAKRAKFGTAKFRSLERQTRSYYDGEKRPC